MKKIIYIIFFLCYYSVIAQVGIGTTTPSSSAVLDITSNDKGLLIPRMSNTQIANISTPEKSLIVFNTDTNNFQFNSGSTSIVNWTTVRSNQNSPSLKYSSTASTEDINTSSAKNIKVFNDLNWNDNSSVFTKINDSEITITNPGRYQVICNVYVKGINSTGTAEQRTGVELFLAINGVQVGVNAATAYIRFINNHDTASLHINETFEINSPSTVSIKSIRKARNGKVNIEMSNIVIKKIR